MQWDFFLPIVPTNLLHIAYNEPDFQSTQYLKQTETWTFVLEAGNTGTPAKMVKTTTINPRTGLRTYTYDPPFGAYPKASPSFDGGVSLGFFDAWILGLHKSPTPSSHYIIAGGGSPYDNMNPGFIEITVHRGPAGDTTSSKTSYNQPYQYGSYAVELSAAIGYADQGSAGNALLGAIDLLNPRRVYTLSNKYNGSDTVTKVAFGYKSDPLPAGAGHLVRSLVVAYPVYGDRNGNVFSPDDQAAGFPETPLFYEMDCSVLTGLNPGQMVAAGIDVVTGGKNGITFAGNPSTGVLAANGMPFEGPKFWTYDRFSQVGGPYRLDAYGFLNGPPSGTRMLISQKSAFRCSQQPYEIIGRFIPRDATLVLVPDPYHPSTAIDPNSIATLQFDQSQPGTIPGEHIYLPEDAPVGGLRGIRRFPLYGPLPPPPGH
ncbi:MAG: hypothetical protein P4N60_13695 [Verrucomicrobiae bacterium]|nr:hypothetical protein [Verrucomicrobiae bacterium]